MKAETEFKLHNIDDVKATLSVTATVAEWRLFLAQCAAHADKTFQWNSSWVGNCYLVQFKHDIDSMLREAESHYESYARKHVDETRQFRAVLDTISPIASADEYREKHGLSK